MSYIGLYKFTAFPFSESRSRFDPLNQLSSLDLHPLLCRFNLRLFPILELPLLLLDRNEAFLQLVASEDDGKRNFLSFASSELCRELGLILS